MILFKLKEIMSEYLFMAISMSLRVKTGLNSGENCKFDKLVTTGQPIAKTGILRLVLFMMGCALFIFPPGVKPQVFI